MNISNGGALCQEKRSDEPGQVKLVSFRRSMFVNDMITFIFINEDIKIFKTFHLLNRSKTNTLA